MRYHCIHLKTSFDEEWFRDEFNQFMANFGVDVIDGDDYYIPSERWEQVKEDMPSVCTLYGKYIQLTGVEECPDENWNAAWEAEHPMQELPLGIRIIPHCAFGAGHHETTSMMIDALLGADLTGKNVLDHGTGTGVLAIFAKRLGAAQVVAVDIDEKSVVNAKENAALNNVNIDVRLGDTVPPFRGEPTEKGFDLILANIHRNILLDNMSAYASSLREGGELWISGFYEEDCAALKEAAEREGLRVIDVLANGEWRLMKCRKEGHS